MEQAWGTRGNDAIGNCCVYRFYIYYIWGLCCQNQVSQTGISIYIPQFTVGCNYLSLPEMPASGNKVLIYHSSNRCFYQLATRKCTGWKGGVQPKTQNTLLTVKHICMSKDTREKQNEDSLMINMPGIPRGNGTDLDTVVAVTDNKASPRYGNVDAIENQTLHKQRCGLWYTHKGLGIEDDWHHMAGIRPASPWWGDNTYQSSSC